MTSYKLTQEGYVILNGDTKVPITDTPEWPNTNPDYLAYKQWLAEGNTPEPADPMTAEVAVAKIAELEEASSSPQRIVREGLILLIESQALAQGLTLAYLRAKNKGYRLLKECDEQISILRKFIP